MKREIKFRGKSKWGYHEWIYGYLSAVKDRYFITPTYWDARGKMKYEMLPDTVGQFTGLYDRDGKEIYEGDIVVYRGEIKQAIEYRHGAFGYEYCNGFYTLAGNSNFTFNPTNQDNNFEVIGNIHDNPELLNDN